MYQRTIYLVDTENIRFWMHCIPELHPKDEVVLFFSENSGTIQIGHLPKVLEMAEHISTVPACCGTVNALDFQLVTWLGFRIAKAPKTNYVIVSKDHGFDVVCKYWTEQGISVSRISQRCEDDVKEPDIAEEKLETKGQEGITVKNPETDSLRKSVQSMLKKRYQTDANISQIMETVRKGNNREIQALANKIAANDVDALGMKNSWMALANKYRNHTGG